MTAHLSAAPFKSADPTYLESDALADLNHVVACLREIPGGESYSALTISGGGAVVPTLAHHTLLPASGTTDNLDFATATNHPDGRLLLLRPNTSGHTITVRHGQSGTNPFALAAGLDFVMASVDHILLLYKRANGTWREITRSYGDDLAAQRAFLGAAYATTSTPGLIQLATPTQIQAGINSSALTPGQWAAASGSNGNGVYWRLPGNRIIQMSAIVTSNSADTTVTLPITMANASYSVTAQAVTNDALTGTPAARLVHCFNRTTTTFQMSAWTAAGARSALQVAWEVKGVEPSP